MTALKDFTSLLKENEKYKFSGMLLNLPHAIHSTSKTK